MIDITELRTATLDPVVADEIERFEINARRYIAGEIDDDAFRVFRLNQGIYGQRQGGFNQMIRVKIPYGKVEPDQLEMFAHIAETYSRGWGHLTTRQNLQYHFVQLDQAAEVLRLLAAVGLTSREACGDTVRNVAGCHLAGACPYEVLDISPWAEAVKDLFLRNPLTQRLPRKFKINLSGCATDCGQAMFNDIGVIAVQRPLPDGSTEPGFRVFMAGGLGANPHPAQAIEEFTTRDDLLATIEAALRVWANFGNRDNKLRARMKWLVDTMGIDELRERIVKERKLLIGSATYPGGVPAAVVAAGDAPAGMGTEATPITGTRVELSGLSPYAKWELANVVRGRANGTISAYAHCRLGDITPTQFRGLADLQREVACEVRITNRQNFVLRGLTDDQLMTVFERLAAIDMAAAGAELVRDVVACPGADTCNLAVTQSRGLASDIDDALEAAGLAEVAGVRINISGCTNSCGQHHTSDIGFFGIERRAHGQAAPGYQMLLGGGVGDMEIEFGHKAVKLPAKAASEAVVRVVGRYASERQAGETFASWLARSGGAAGVGTTLTDLDAFPDPTERPDFYVDFGETGPYVKEVGDSECAT
jgi:sulfite reductase beta subunit-like hemoprotein